MIHSGCLLKLAVIGLNHKTAELDFREIMAKGASALSGEKALFFSHPTILLSTCNRTEIYFSADDLAEAHSDLLIFLRRHIDDSFEHRLYSYFGLDAFFHLSRVAAGLDSAIFAESEIQRQVKVAYQNAARISKLPSCVHYAFQKALKIGKEVRTIYGLSSAAPNLASTIWELANSAFEDLPLRKLLFIGHSEINRNLAAYFNRKKGPRLFLSTKQPSAVRIPDCTVFDRSELLHWRNYDLIIAASASDQYLISGVAVRPQLIFDLSVPRNVDPQLKTSPKITLYNIETLNEIVAEKRQAHLADSGRIDELVRARTIQLARLYRENRSAQLLGL